MQIPVILSVREETITMHTDIFGSFRKKHIMPPPFNEVLKKRCEAFKDHLQSAKDDSQNEISNDKLISFVEIVRKSITQPETYTHLISLSNHDLDLLLDMTRILLESPFIDPEFVIDNYLNDEKLIPWHIILNKLMLYIYSTMNERNSFILNMYDNGTNVSDDPPTANNLVRLRTLQCISALFQGKIEKPIKVGHIYGDMENIGYSENIVHSALKSFASVRLLLTGNPNNAFGENVREVYLQRAISFYLNYLAFRYRYIQNILPITKLDFNVDIPLVVRSQNLPQMSTVIRQFIKHIEKCERTEQVHIKNTLLFQKITRGESISANIRRMIEDETLRMKNYPVHENLSYSE